jgi:ABC-type transporter Mla MlaB component
VSLDPVPMPAATDEERAWLLADIAKLDAAQLGFLIAVVRVPRERQLPITLSPFEPITPQHVRALALAHELKQLLNDLRQQPEHGYGTGVNCAHDYMEDVIAQLEDRTAFPVRPPSRRYRPKQGGPPRDHAV